VASIQKYKERQFHTSFLTQAFDKDWNQMVTENLEPKGGDKYFGSKLIVDAEKDIYITNPNPFFIYT
jgi:hypothetical protein